MAIFKSYVSYVKLPEGKRMSVWKYARIPTVHSSFLPCKMAKHLEYTGLYHSFWHAHRLNTQQPAWGCSSTCSTKWVKFHHRCSDGVPTYGGDKIPKLYPLLITKKQLYPIGPIGNSPNIIMTDKNLRMEYNSYGLWWFMGYRWR